MQKEKTPQEFYELIQTCLDDPKEIALQDLTNEQVKAMALITTIIQVKNKKIRDKLIEIRSQMDIPRANMIMQSKQQITNLIKELQ